MRPFKPEEKNLMRTTITKPTPLVTLGDLAQVGADALVFPTDSLGLDSVVEGKLHQAFRKMSGFYDAYKKAHRDYLRQKKQDQLRIGDAFWVPLVGESPCGVVVVAVVVEFDALGDAFRVSQSASLCMEAALECARQHLSPRDDSTPLKPYVIASPAILLGHGGGNKEPERIAKGQLEAASRVIQKYSDFDTLFVLYTDRDLRLFLDARK